MKDMNGVDKVSVELGYWLRSNIEWFLKQVSSATTGYPIDLQRLYLNINLVHVCTFVYFRLSGWSCELLFLTIYCFLGLLVIVVILLTCREWSTKNDDNSLLMFWFCSSVLKQKFRKLWNSFRESQRNRRVSWKLRKYEFRWCVSVLHYSKFGM